MNIFDENIKKEVREYENTINSVKEEGFLSQFKLQEIDGITEGSKERFSTLDTPSLYNVDRRDFTLEKPRNFEKLHNAPSGRRDNSLVINENFTLTQKKVENDQLLKPKRNINARLASGVIYNNNLDNFKKRIVINKNNNEYDPETMYLRTEKTDGVPLNENIRALPKTQENLRTNTINSQRLSSNNRMNKVQIGITKSKNPEDENITKFKAKTYREQKSPHDFLRTTGQFIKPEHRTKIELHTNRTTSMPVIGPARTSIDKEEFRNDQPLRKTIKEETVLNNNITNVRSVLDKPIYHNNQNARPTDRENNNEHISNPKSFVDSSYVPNNQPANQTLRETFNDQITNTKSFVDKSYIKNDQPASQTLREKYNDQVTNPRSNIDKSYYNNDQKPRQTLRETYNEQVTNVKASVDKSYTHNNQPATETIREQTENNSFTGAPTGFTLGKVVHNNQDARKTIKEQTVEQNYSGVGYRDSAGKLYKNNQSAQQTLRENQNSVSGSAYSNSGYVYHNSNQANPTIRQVTGTSSYSGPFDSGNTRIYLKTIDKTRSGFVEDVLPKNYKGGGGSMVTETQSRDIMDNYVQYEKLEQGLDLTKIQPIGGRGQIDLGSNNFGVQTDKDRRGIKEDIKIPKSIVGSNYIAENNETYLETRGRELLQKRVNINPHLEESLNGNPYINNNVFKSISKKDIISEKTNKSDRILDPVVKNNLIEEL